jgi:multicomponent Na+:H+ antiporter subunit G
VSSAPHVASVVLVSLGTAVIVAACLGALVAPDVFSKLHYSTPITSLGGPLIAIGLSVDSGANLTTASILFPAALLFFCSPILSAAIGRCAAKTQGQSDTESPE